MGEPNRVVAPVVPKLEFESVSTKGLAHKLVSHADAEGGHLANYLLANFHCIRHR